jgi:hypothetical protein
MAKKKAPPKKRKTESNAKKSAAAKKVVQKAKAAATAKKSPIAKAKLATKSKPLAKSKTTPKRTPPISQASVVRGNQDVETVRLKPKSRVARAGTGSGDLQGISIVEDVDSESADELLEEGQAFEAGIVSGVESAGNAEESEVITHEVLEDDVPKEYDDERP